MKTRPVIITYKTKVRELCDADGSPKPYIDYKRALTRRDCNLRPHEHDYYNSDMFIGMLNRAHKAATGGREWCCLCDLPTGVTVDATGFLATVTITTEV